MAKKGEDSKKASSKKPSSKKKAGAEKQDEKTARKAAKRAALKLALEKAKAAAKQARAARRKQAGTPSPAQPDQVEVLKLALRDTEAKLVDAEHRLRQVQQQLDDERRALTEAAEEAIAEAVVDAAVAETVAEAVADADLVAGGEDPAVVAEVVAETLDEVAAAAEPRDEAPDHSGEAAAAAAAFSEPDGVDLTPPLPTEPPADAPSEEWTLVRLRSEARRRGLTGVSTLSKAGLLERLNRA